MADVTAVSEMTDQEQHGSGEHIGGVCEDILGRILRALKHREERDRLRAEREALREWLEQEREKLESLKLNESDPVAMAGWAGQALTVDDVLARLSAPDSGTA